MLSVFRNRQVQHSPGDYLERLAINADQRGDYKAASAYWSAAADQTSDPYRVGVRRRNAERCRRRSGFSLVELMIAIGIFAIGAVAVVAVFPVAAMLQRETMNDSVARAFADNAEAIIAARGFDAVDLATIGDAVIASAPHAWSLTDRSYRAGIPTADRKLFWVPLFFDRDAGPERDWYVYVFVVRGVSTATYDKSSGVWANPSDPSVSPGVPGVRRIAATPTKSDPLNPLGPLDRFDFNNVPRLVRVGDRVLDAMGRDWIVDAADDSGVKIRGVIPPASTVDVWFADPGDSERSAFAAIHVLHGNDMVR